MRKGEEKGRERANTIIKKNKNLKQVPILLQKKEELHKEKKTSKQIKENESDTHTHKKKGKGKERK